MNTQDSGAGYAYWLAPDGSSKVIYSLAVASDIDALVNDGFRRIPHGGVESGGFLFGTRSGGVAKIEAFQPIECQHAFGPSFVLSERDLDNMRSQLRASAKDDQLAGLRPLGWFLGHTRAPFHLQDRELAWFNEFFPESGCLTLLIKPERFQATRFAFLVRDSDGHVERDGNRASFILPLSGQGGGLSKSPAPSIPAPAQPSPAQPAPAQSAPPPSALPRPREPHPLPPLPMESVLPLASHPAEISSADDPMSAVSPAAKPISEETPRSTRAESVLPPAPAASEEHPSRSDSAFEPTTYVAPPSSAAPGAASAAPEKTAPIAGAPEKEKTAPLPASPFRKATPPSPAAQSKDTVSSAPSAIEKTAPIPAPAQPAPSEIPKPLGGQVTRLRTPGGAPPPPASPYPPSNETRSIFPSVAPPPAPFGGKTTAPQPEPADSKLAFPYASLPPTRVRVSPKLSAETFGLRSAAVLVLAALLGCLAGYWAYLQLPSPVIPVSVREQSSQFLVEWPSAQTSSVDYAALQVNDGQWVTLNSEQKSAGRAVITPPPTGDLKIDLLAKHWLRDSRGIVRYIRTSR